MVLGGRREVIIYLQVYDLQEIWHPYRILKFSEKEEGQANRIRNYQQRLVIQEKGRAVQTRVDLSTTKAISNILETQVSKRPFLTSQLQPPLPTACTASYGALYCYCKWILRHQEKS